MAMAADSTLTAESYKGLNEAFKMKYDTTL